MPCQFANLFALCLNAKTWLPTSQNKKAAQLGGFHCLFDGSGA
jgi:hypothetical protein